MAKRYYWLRLKSDLFSSKRIKKLRKLGDCYFVIYLKLQLKSLDTNGVLTYTGLEDTFAAELALDIDEQPKKVQKTIDFLSENELLLTDDGISYLLPYVQENTGSETASAQRVRSYRQRGKALQCNTDATLM